MTLLAFVRALRNTSARWRVALFAIFLALPAFYYFVRSILAGEVTGAVLFGVLFVGVLLLIWWQAR